MGSSRRANRPDLSLRSPVRQRVTRLHPVDLLVEQFVFHGQLADFGMQLPNLIVPTIPVVGFQGSQSGLEEFVSPLRDGGGRHVVLSGQDFDGFSFKEPRHDLLLALG